MRKWIALCLAGLLMISCCTACGTNGAKNSQGNDRLQIVTTIFPVYDWTIQALGSNPADAEVTMLLDKGVDLHSFQPTAEDILKISTCDLFIYVGGESDAWVDDALKEATNQNMVVIDLMDVLGDAAKEEEVVEGMQEDEHEHEEHEEEVEYDEHIWLSLRNAEVLTDEIAQALQKIDPANAGTYKDNAAAYIEKLDALDQAYQAAVAEAARNTLLFGDRFPFRYLVDDYGLSYYAAFVGCSAETEASFETISFLAQKVDELSLPVVMTIEGSDHRIAETIIQNTQGQDQKICSMDSMQSITGKDVEQGAAYLTIMEHNLTALKEALQ